MVERLERLANTGTCQLSDSILQHKIKKLKIHKNVRKEHNTAFYTLTGQTKDNKPFKIDVTDYGNNGLDFNKPERSSVWGLNPQGQDHKIELIDNDSVGIEINGVAINLARSNDIFSGRVIMNWLNKEIGSKK